MNRQKIENLLRILGERLEHRGVKGHLFLVGGGAIAVAYNSERWTRDIDAIFEPKTIIYEVASEMSTDLGEPEDWLNDAVKVFMFGEDPLATEFFDSPGLNVSVASSYYLLAMKLLSSRIEEDTEDIELLLDELNYASDVDPDEVFRDLQGRWPVLETGWSPKSRFLLGEILARRSSPG